MQKILLIILVVLTYNTFSFAQVIGEIEFKMTKSDAQSIRDLAAGMLVVQQDMLNNSAAAFDAVFSRLDGVKMDDSQLSTKWVFSVSKVVVGVLDATEKSLPVPCGPIMDFLESIYDNASDHAKANAEIRTAQSVNSTKELLAQVAEKRTAIFGKQQSDFERQLIAKFNTEGPSYLRRMEEEIKVLETALARKAGENKMQVLLFEFEILEELINGINQAEFNNRGFLQCEVWMEGCSNVSDWDKSIFESKINGCPVIKEARYTFQGESGQQFQQAVNQMLAGFRNVPVAERKTIIDFNTIISYEIYPPGAAYLTCRFIFPVSQQNSVQRMLNDYSWENCGGGDGYYFMAFRQSSKLDNLFNPVVEKVNKARFTNVGQTFFVSRF